MIFENPNSDELENPIENVDLEECEIDFRPEIKKDEFEDDIPF